MRLAGDAGQTLSIERSELGEAGTPAEEDLLLNVTVVVAGYSASDQVWVVADAWRGFIHELQAVEKFRQGRATLLGASPKDLNLTFKVADRAGHMAVLGLVGWDSPDGFHQKLEFGFAFDAGLLSNVIRDLEALER